MSKTETKDANIILVSKLSIERCQNHLAHLHALMHLAVPYQGDFSSDEAIAESFLKVMETMEKELLHSARILSRLQ